jgi:hypothetical protein
MRPAAGECPSFRFFAEFVSTSGEEFAEATARCMNFMVRSLDETPLGVSGAMVEGLYRSVEKVSEESTCRQKVIGVEAQLRARGKISTRSVENEE